MEQQWKDLKFLGRVLKDRFQLSLQSRNAASFLAELRQSWSAADVVPRAGRTLNLQLTPRSAPRGGDDKAGAGLLPRSHDISLSFRGSVPFALLLTYSCFPSSATQRVFRLAKRRRSFATKAIVFFTFSKESVLNRELCSSKKSEIRHVQMKHYLLN